MPSAYNSIEQAHISSSSPDNISHKATRPSGENVRVTFSANGVARRGDPLLIDDFTPTPASIGRHQLRPYRTQSSNSRGSTKRGEF